MVHLFSIVFFFLQQIRVSMVFHPVLMTGFSRWSQAWTRQNEMTFICPVTILGAQYGAVFERWSFLCFFVRAMFFFESVVIFFSLCLFCVFVFKFVFGSAILLFALQNDQV